MSGGIVEYIVSLKDMFSTAASKIATASAQAERAVGGMGKAVNAAEAAMTRAGAAASAASRGTAAMAKGFESVGASAKASIASVRSFGAEVASVQKRMEGGLMGAMWGGKGNAGGKGGGSGGHGGAGPMFSGNHNVMEHALNAYLGYSLARGGVHAVGSILERTEEQMMAKQKMALVGFTPEQIKQADDMAEKMSMKYKNVSKGKVLEQIYEGVSIHGDGEHAIHRVEAQTRFAAFLQGFQGGKNGGRSNEWNKEVFAAIKSMEMYGTLNKEHPEEDINKYLGSMMAMKALYGDQAKISEYLTMQRRAGASFYRLSDEFRLGILPAILQERGGATVGQQLMTGFQTIVGGTKLRESQVATLKHYGLLDDKTGRFRNDLVQGYLKDPMAVAGEIAKTVAAKNGLNPNDPKQLDQLKDKLVRDMGWLFPNRNAAALTLDMILNDKNYKRHADALRRTREEIQAYAEGADFASKTLAGAQARVGSRWDDFLASLGEPLRQPAIDNLNWLSDQLKKLQLFTKANPGAVNAGAWAASAGAVMLFGAALWRLARFAYIPQLIGTALLGLGKITGFNTVLSSLAVLTARLLRLTGVARALAVLRLGSAFVLGYEVIANWDSLIGVIEKLSGMDLSGIKGISRALYEITTALGSGGVKALLDSWAVITGKERGPGERIPVPEFNDGFTPQGSGEMENFEDRRLKPLRINSMEDALRNIGPLPVDVNVNAPQQVQIVVTGRVDGSSIVLNGTGNVPLSAAAGRGQAVPDAGTPAQTPGQH